MKINKLFLFLSLLIVLPFVSSASISPAIATIGYISGETFEYTLTVGSDYSETFLISASYDDLSEEVKSQLEGSISFDKDEIFNIYLLHKISELDLLQIFFYFLFCIRKINIFYYN